MDNLRPIAAARDLNARVTAPPSKSVMQRALVAAALAPGVSRLLNPLLAGDSLLLIAALKAVGIPARIRSVADVRSVADMPSDADVPSDAGIQVVEIEGGGGRIPAEVVRLEVGNAGTAMRFLTGMLAAGHGTYIIDGDARMRRRPIEDLLRALRALGAAAESVAGNGCPPVGVGGRGLPGGVARLRGSRSSQYLSAILLAAPAAAGEVRVEMEGGLVSRPYIDLTIDVMRRFGVEVMAAPPGPSARSFTVAAGQAYRPTVFSIEGDHSSASYSHAAAAVAGGRVRVDGLQPDSRQGDARFPDLLARMGCRVERGPSSVVVERTGVLEGIDADLSGMPDMAPTLAVVALFAKGPTRISGVPHLRIKESDRIASLVREIRRLGGEAEEHSDGLTVVPRPLHGATVETYGDHRVAMAFAVAGLRVPGIAIRDPGCVAKSFPAFWDSFDLLARAR
jgi:3-phosphoshikimate 1-carboxyvinyltransferase